MPYKWQENAVGCEVCRFIGHTEREQRAIQKDGLCFRCGPIGNAHTSKPREIANIGNSYRQGTGVRKSRALRPK